MHTSYNIFTVDLEEWFVVEILSGRYPYDDWDKLESTVIRSTFELLELLESKNVKSTWFVLGWVAEKYPELIQEIYSKGHEIACHSHKHQPVSKIGKTEFIKDTEKSIEVITNAIGVRPIGYRAPSWSVNDTTPWFFETLANLGFSYDSSIFSIKHDLYGWPDGPTKKLEMQFENAKRLIEVPASTVSLMGKKIPVAGGGYFRHSPYWYTRTVVRKMNEKGIPAIFYIHPWEMGDYLPKIEGLSMIQRFRTYSSNSILKMKVEKLLDDFNFITMADYLNLSWKKRIGFS